MTVSESEDYSPSPALQHIANVCQILNPSARIVFSAFSKVDLESLLNSRSLDFDEAAQNPGWLKELRDDGTGGISHVPESEEYGIISFVYRARKPFHPMKLHLFMMAKMMKGVFRAKGFFWIATRNDICFTWSQAAELVDFEDGGNWFATIPEEEWEAEFANMTESAIKDIKKDFDGKYGDRRQALVFIGDQRTMDKEALIEQLDSCLLSKEEMEMGPDGWAEKLEDPFELDLELEHEAHGHHHHEHARAS